MAKPKKPWIGEDRMKVRTYGVWPKGSWQQVAPQVIAAVRVTPSYDEPHPSGAPAAEFEIVYVMEGDPDEAGARHSLVLGTREAYRLTAMLMAAWESTGGSEPALFGDEQVTIGETVKVRP